MHQARKRFKELRALLRLVREPLGARFKLDNRRLRDVGRRLAESRDAAAMLESWDAPHGPTSHCSSATRSARFACSSSAPRRMARCTRISTRSWPKCWVSCVR